MVKLEDLEKVIESLRKEAIGEPAWIFSKQVFEYGEHSPRVVAVLKLVRAAHGISALSTLCQHGLFIDFGAIMRGVRESLTEIYFLLEEFPKSSGNVDQFVKAFFENHIEGYLQTETPPVPAKKIRSAMTRVLKAGGGGAEDQMRTALQDVYQAFSGYVHANYAHVMEVYGGGIRSFNVRGVPSREEIRKRWDHVELAFVDVLHAAAFIALRLGLADQFREIRKVSHQYERALANEA